MPLKLAVLLSGNGTTLQNFIDRIARGELDADIRCVLSSKAGAYGLTRAKDAGIHEVEIQRKDHADSASFNAALWREVDAHAVDLVVLAGFMNLLTVPEAYRGRIMNVHPALIPAFCGKGMYGHHVHEAVIDKGVKITGVTVHLVDNQYDHGPIVLQEALPVLEDDTPESLAARVQALERELYPKAITLFGQNRLKVENHRVRIVPQGPAS